MSKRIEKVDLSVKDPFEDIRISAEKAEKEVNLLSDVIAKLNENIEKTSKKAKNISLTGANPKDADDMKQAMDKHREALRLAKEREKQEKLLTQAEKHREKALKDKWSAEQSLQKQREKSIAQIEREKAKTQEAERPYNKMSATLNKLRKEYKDLAVSGQESTEEARKLRIEIDKLDKSLKGADASVGQFQRNVGNYPTSFSQIGASIGGMLGAIGIGFSALELKGVVDDMKALQIQAQQLGFSSENIDKLAVSSKALADTFGVDQREVMQSANTIVKEFGVSVDDAMKQLENGYLSGANAQGDLTDQVKEYSTQIKASGGDVNTLMAIISKSNEAGIFSDKGVDAVKEFGLRIREQTTATGDAMRSAFGDEFTKRIFDGINNGSMTSIEALEEISKKMNDTSIPANKLQTVIADVFGGAGEDAGLGFLQTLTDINSATNDVVNSTDPLIIQQQETLRLNEELAQSQLKFAETLGGTNTSIDQLIIKAKILFFNNIVPAIGFVAKLTAGFVAFKTVTAIANTDFKSLISNFTKFKTEAGEGTSKMSGFGNALKGVGWSVAIGLVIELGTAMWEFYNGTFEATAVLKNFEKANQQLAKTLGKVNNEFKAEIENKKLLIREELADGKITESVAKQKIKSLDELTQSRLKNTRLRLDAMKSEQKALLSNLEAERENMSEYLNPIEYGKITAEITLRKGAIMALNEQLKNTISEQKSLVFNEKEQLVLNKELKKETDKNTESNKKNTKSIAEKTKKYKDAKDVIDELIAKQKEYDDANLAQQNELDEGLVTAQRTNLDFELEAEEKELQAVRDKYRRLEDLAIEFGYGQEELLEARLNEENEIRTKYAQEEQNQIDEENAKKLEKEKQALAERRQLTKQFIDATIDEMKRLSDEEIKEIDERINAEKELQSNLQQQANSGSIEAQKSIEASKEAERKATLEKAKEQKKQQALDDIKTLYNLINSNLDNGDNVSIATTKAVASMSIVKSVASVFSKLTGFKDGTDFRLGDEHKPMFGGVDGHVVRVDSSEGIVRGDLMDKAERAGLKSMDDIVNSAVSYTHKSVPMTVVSNTFKTDKLERKLDAVIDAVKSKNEFSIDPFVVNGIAKGVVANTRNRNFTKKDIYRA